VSTRGPTSFTLQAEKPSMIIRRKPGKGGRSRAGQIEVAALCFKGRHREVRSERL
jgi:hypothetical protein